MPSPYVKKLAQETGREISEIESRWSEAKNLAAESLGKPESDFLDEDYKYVVGTLKNMLGIHEGLKVKDFLDSGVNARDFIETVISSQFNIGKVIPPIAKRHDLDNDDQLPGEDREGYPPKRSDDPAPKVIQLGMMKEMLKCLGCEHKFLGMMNTTPCPECGLISSKSLSEVRKRVPEKKDNPEDTELETQPFHVDTPIDIGRGASNNQEDIIDREFAFLNEDSVDTPSKPIFKEEPSPAKARALAEQIRQRHINGNEDNEVDLESMREFDAMIEADKNRR
jgi:hypothetical protein